MKARFYRGPYNGKVREVRDDEQFIVVADIPNGKISFLTYNLDPMSMTPVRKSVYHRTRHTHPDGSVFFEWDQPRKK